MEHAFSKAEELIDNIKEYVNIKIDTAKVVAAERSSRVIANLVAGIVLVLFFLFFLFFGSVALSILLGTWIGKAWAGFLIVAFFYLLAGIIMWTRRTKLIRLPVMNALLRNLNKKDGKD